ncbi:MAG: hypothetical protein Q9182_002289 [Xanthomendoza sp. 2 TL-2023]
MPYINTTPGGQSTSPSNTNNGNQSCEFIDSPQALTTVLDTLSTLPKEPPSLYIDLEGVSLSRHGTISILQILATPLNRTYLIDIHTLTASAFHTRSTDRHTTLKSLLESPGIPKVFFDVRRDSDALYAHFGINLKGIHDLQLMELGTRGVWVSKKFVNSLERCVEKDAGLTVHQLQQWSSATNKGLDLFDPQRGGSYEVFNIRPLSAEVRDYCVQVVAILPSLWAVYHPKMTGAVVQKVEAATKDWVLKSQSENFNAADPGMKLGPWNEWGFELSNGD